MSAGAEKFAGRLPEGVVLCNARGAHTPATAEWVVAPPCSPPSGAAALHPRAGRRPLVPRTHRLLAGRRPVLVVGAGDIGRTVGR